MVLRWITFFYFRQNILKANSFLYQNHKRVEEPTLIHHQLHIHIFMHGKGGLIFELLDMPQQQYSLSLPFGDSTQPCIANFKC